MQRQSTITNRSFYNLISSVILVVVNVVFGLVVPRLYLHVYGSDIFGLISSITQVLGYLNLVEFGLSAASIQALYNPIANKRWSDINCVLSTTRNYYLRAGMLFTLLIVLLSALYPLIIKEQVSSLIVSLLVLIMSGGTAVELFLYAKYRVLLMADQRLSIVNNFQIAIQIIRTLIVIPLILYEQNILLVQAVSSILYLFRVPILAIYIKRNYPKVNYRTGSDCALIEKRWDVLWHQVSGLIVYNTPTLILTITSNLKMVSLYSVYNLVFSMLYSMLSMAFSQSAVAGFGQIMARKENHRLEIAYNQFEYIYYISLTWVYSVAYILIGPFIMLYTKGVDDIEYVDKLLSLLFTMVGFLNNFRIPMLTMVNAKGDFGETKNSAIIEAAINFFVSIVFVRFYGIYGVLIGAIASYIYRTTYLMVYSSSKIIRQPINKTISRIFRNIITSIIISIFFQEVFVFNVNRWVSFVAYGTIVALISLIIVIVVNVTFEIDISKQLLKRFAPIVNVKVN